MKVQFEISVQIFVKAVFMGCPQFVSYQASLYQIGVLEWKD